MPFTAGTTVLSGFDLVLLIEFCSAFLNKCGNAEIMSVWETIAKMCSLANVVSNVDTNSIH